MAMTARDHNNLLGIFFIIKGCLLGFVGLLMGVIYAGVGVAIMGSGHRGEEQLAGGAVMVFGLLIGIVIAGIGLFDLFTGFKVRKAAPVARILGIIVSIMSLFSFPLGTALGVYGLWFFFGDVGKGLYLAGAAAPGSYDPPPPPPNSWQ